MSHQASSNPRFNAIEQVSRRVPRFIDWPKDANGNTQKVSDYYGINTFSLQVMRERLSRDAYGKIQQVIRKSVKLEKSLADEVANALKEWAIERGVTHFCHWFQPQTGMTAEKHDAFLSFDDNQRPVEKLSGSQLIQSEPDASSFPSGGMRTTFEARGYTAWDPSSPIFIMESANTRTLCIPSVFISYFGDALDEKAGLLRSADALSSAAKGLLETLGNKDVDAVIPTLGTEQEYFLVDRAFYFLRPDLVMSGRSLVGAQPPRGQQLEDHYFGTIPTRAQAFMGELEQELYRLGVPIKTRHNEVAPSQFEMAPVFEDAEVASDHNQLAMDMIKKVARRHNFEALLHEKPFAELNGSGKHSNWSMACRSEKSAMDGTNLLDPGKTPHENLQFLLFLMATMKGVNKHAGILRAGIASVGNDHRLGANEAPPAIISVFLGHALSDILDRIESETELKSAEDEVIKLGVGRLPEVAKDNTDRNRTSPFAFTGNKFEFRAVGSSAGAAFPVTLLNAAVAEGINEINEALKSKMKGKGDLDQAVFSVIRDAIKETKAVRFEGNNYSDDWVKEAQKRGIHNLRKTPEALDQLLEKQSINLFSSLKVFSEAEVQSRFNVRIERYNKAMWIELETLRTMVDTQIFPAAVRYHSEILESITRAKAAGTTAPQNGLLSKLSSLIQDLQDKRSSLDAVMSKIESEGDDRKQAGLLSQDGAHAMEDLRGICDQLELVVADDYWPLPKYREMLFLN